MIVTVASGKGGTGKTTVAVNLAVIAIEAVRAKEGFVELFDCDVEEPNAHLFVKPQNIVTQEISTMIPVVDMELCTLCGECEKICQFSAITMIAKKIMVFPEMCHSCKGCSMVCPTDALKEGSRLLGSLLTGYWYCGQSSMTDHSSESSVINKSARGFKLTWGELRVGEAMSPPLIKQVKKMISCETENIDSKQLNNQISIVDAPPGTSCPAVTTLRDSDFALLVAEETPFGLNDLALTVEALKKLHVPMGIVINRTDGEKGIIDNYADKENIEIMQRIPFSREAAKVCAKGLFLVDEIPEMKTLFQELYLKIINKVSRGRQQGEEIEERIKNNRRKTERGSENERANSDKW